MNKLYFNVFQKLFITIISVVLLNFSASAQCPVTALASPLSIQCGDTVKLNAIADGCKPLNTNFNGGTMGTGWQATTGASVTDCSGSFSCFGSPSEGPYCLFMGSNVAAPRDVTTNDFDLKQCGSNGAIICFDMKYSVQGGNGICEGIDAPGEGIYLQYSINGGTSWVTLQYWDPNGGFDATLTNWNRYCITVPAAAYTNSTRFRWYQGTSSGAGFDTWGLDDMVITLLTPGYTYDWSHDALGPASTPTTPNVTPATNTTYTVTYTNGVNTCSSSVAVTVTPITATITATPAQVCLNGQTQLDIVASTIPPAPATCGNSVTGCQGVSAVIPMGTGTTAGTYFPLGRATSGTCLNGSGSIDNGFRMQIIIRASELPAYYKYGQIYNLALTFVGVTANNYENFTISMGCTNKTAFANSTDYVTGLTTVYGPKAVALSNGAKTFDFDRHFDWTGTSNIVIQICWLASGARKGDVQKTASGFNSTIYAMSCASTGCTETANAAMTALRPSMQLGICYRVPPVLSYSWAPAAPLNNNTIKNPVATLTATTSFNVTIADATRPMCNVTKSINVIAADPSLTVNPQFTTVCNSGPTSVALTSTGTPSISGGSIVSYQWTPTTGLSNANISNPTASPTVTTTYVVKVTDNNGCTASKNVIIGYCVSVPIELFSFDVFKQGEKVLVTWSTASEKNSDFFEIERSGDGVSYTPIGKVLASGTSKITKNYQFTDDQPLRGVNYYRLRAVDKDQYWKSSEVEAVSFDLKEAVFSLTKLSPVPVQNQLNYIVTNEREEWVLVKISDIRGKLIKNEKKHVLPGNNGLASNVEDLEKGLYFLQVTRENGSSVVQKFVK